MKKVRTGLTLQERENPYTDRLTEKKEKPKNEKQKERHRERGRKAYKEDKETAMSPVFTKKKDILQTAFLKCCPVPVSQIPHATVISC